MGAKDLAGFARDALRRVDDGYYDVAADARHARANNGSLARAVASATPFAVVAEVKRRSPGHSDHTRDLSAADQTVAYLRGGACAVSVLSDPDNFAGGLSDLDEAHAAGAPVLMKDFVVDEGQLDAGVAHGASAVLAIVTLHDRKLARLGLDELVDAAHDRGLEVLAEARTDAELDAARHTDADLFGVNCRNLDTLAMEPARCAGVVAGYEDERPLLWLSGIASNGDAARAVSLGATGVLVGTHLVASGDPAAAVRELLGGADQ